MTVLVVVVSREANKCTQKMIKGGSIEEEEKKTEGLCK